MMRTFIPICFSLASLVGCAKFKEGDCIQNIRAGYIWRITNVKTRPLNNQYTIQGWFDGKWGVAVDSAEAAHVDSLFVKIGCPFSTETIQPDASTPSATSGKADPDAPRQPTWARIRECATQANKFAARERLDSDKAVVGRQNHYNSDGRCYALITYLNSEARSKPTLLPAVYYELWDAFEGRLLAICTDNPVSGRSSFCNIQEDDQGFVDCGICRSFVKSRMTN